MELVAVVEMVVPMAGWRADRRLLFHAGFSMVGVRLLLLVWEGWLVVVAFWWVGRRGAEWGFAVLGGPLVADVRRGPWEHWCWRVWRDCARVVKGLVMGVSFAGTQGVVSGLLFVRFHLSLTVTLLLPCSFSFGSLLPIAPCYLGRWLGAGFGRCWLRQGRRERRLP